MQGWLPSNAFGSRPTPKLLLAIGLAALLLAGGGYFAWIKLSASSLPAGIAKANGRIEAERVDVVRAGLAAPDFPWIFVVLPLRIELRTSPLPRECSTTELRQPGWTLASPYAGLRRALPV